MPADGEPFVAAPGGIRLRVRLQPRSSRAAIEGIEQTIDGPALKARVRAIPEDGRANAALEKLVADWLGVPRSSVTLAAGARSRVKMLAISGPTSLLIDKARAALATIAASKGGRA